MPSIMSDERSALSTRAFPVIIGSPEILYPFVFAALSDAEANTLRLEML